MLLAGHTIDRLDPEAAEELLAVVERLGERQVQVGQGFRDQVSDMLQRAAGAGRAKRRLLPTQAWALEALYEEAHSETREETCPLRTVVAAP